MFWRVGEAFDWDWYRTSKVKQSFWLGFSAECADRKMVGGSVGGILLLARIPAPKVKHNLVSALQKITGAGTISLGLTEPTKKFIEYIDTYGPWRYLELSPFTIGGDIVRPDKDSLGATTIFARGREFTGSGTSTWPACTQETDMRRLLGKDH